MIAGPRYTPGSYPTELRGTATSFSLGCSFLTLSFMPIIDGVLIESQAASINRHLRGAGAACGKKFPPRTELAELSPSKLLSNS